MDTETQKHGGKRDNAGRKTVDTEKREYRYFLTFTEKQMIDEYRQSRKLPE